MALSTAEIVRMRLNDPYRRSREVQHGDGTASGFKLAQGAPYSIVISATASVVSAGVGWSATAATFDNSAGYVVFSGTISANTAAQYDYLWAVFSDDEIAYFTAQGGISQAVLMGVHTLMGNSWKRARWQAPDGSEYDDTKAMASLVQWRSALRAEMIDDIGPEGGVESWAETQGNYG